LEQFVAVLTNCWFLILKLGHSP